MLTRIVSMLTKLGQRSYEVGEGSGLYGNFDYDYDNDNDNESQGQGVSGRVEPSLRSLFHP